MIELPTGTLVATFAGFVTVTVGGVISFPVPVCQLHGLGTNPLTSALPATSFAAIETVDLYQVLAVRRLSGLNVAVVPE